MNGHQIIDTSAADRGLAAERLRTDLTLYVAVYLGAYVDAEEDIAFIVDDIMACWLAERELAGRFGFWNRYVERVYCAAAAGYMAAEEEYTGQVDDADASGEGDDWYRRRVWTWYATLLGRRRSDVSK